MVGIWGKIARERNAMKQSFTGKALARNSRLLLTLAIVLAASLALGQAESFAQASSNSIWNDTTIPATAGWSDPSAIELGVKFRSDVNGYITGLRFYKSSFNTGQHVGNLWTSTGTLLATVTFTNETASGWQQVMLSDPVAVTANTMYVASYHTNTGYYAANPAYFASSEYANPPLRALASGSSGGNGVYRYGSSAFPDQTYNACNYWVDVVFATSLAPDTTPPNVTAFAVPSTATALTVSITTFTASDDVGVTGYMVNESAESPSAGSSAWSATAPASYTFASAGAKTLHAWAKDAAGNVSASRSASVTITIDTTTPSVTGFSVPGSASSLIVPITSLTATDDVGVTGYLVNESSATPSAGAAGWSSGVPDSYTFTSAGAKTLYAWAKDAAGHVSASRSASVTITLADASAPTVTAFTIPSTAAALSVPITSFTANDNVGVTGYLVNESPASPSAGASGWLTAVPASYTFASAGAKTLYAWAKDAAGNVSAGRSASVTITLQSSGPEPTGWYAGDMHVHRSCGGSPESVSSLYEKMSVENLAFISLLADMGNGEVRDPTTDLPLVTGSDDPISTPDRIVHWDTEWHWDPTYTQYPHLALGGHLVALGLTSAHTIWEEYTYPILEWAHQQNAIAGFAHMQYLENDEIPESLNCCKPIEYPVEVALGKADFIEEDVQGSDSFIQAYYRLLNTGFRPGFAAGTDYPCGVSTLGALLTYVQVANGQMTYDNWIAGIAGGRTVVSRNGHREFMALTVNGNATPGDEIKLTGGGSVPVNIQWTATQSLSGTIELVQNGVVVASQSATAGPGAPAGLTTSISFTRSGWLAARRMDGNGHQVHTAAVFVLVDNEPIRVNKADAQFYIQWIDNLIEKTSPGGAWNSYFTNSLAAAQARYLDARAVFQQIADETPDTTPPTVTTVSPANGASGVNAGASVTVIFSEAMSAASIGGSTFLLRDPSNTLVAASVAYNSATHSATLTPNGPLTTGMTYTATVKGGTQGVTDTAGNALSSDFTWTFATTANMNPVYSIWNNTTTPAVLADSDTNAVELGVKFQSDVAGYITGLRFYKSSANTGTHIGNLWTSTGALLATVTFTVETASGWQEMALPAPVAIAADTTYVASYHTTVGHYSADSSYFASSAFSNPPLRAIANGADGGNGVYKYGASAFPNQTFNSCNYWVDVVFTTSVTQDSTAPTVTAFTIPAASSTLVVPINSLTATDDVGVTGYLVTESATAPSAGAAGWSASAPGAYAFTSAGAKTLYAWAMDAAGHVSASMSASVTVTISDTTPPSVTAFTIPGTSASLSVPIGSFAANDNVGVTGYLLTETAGSPSAGATGWSTAVPSSYTFSSAGARTLYAWAKDAAGNVSSSMSAQVSITLPDTSPPTVTAFTLPTAVTTLIVPIANFTATDDNGVTGYFVSESSTAPLPGAAGWSTTAPSFYTFTSIGDKTLYAWAKDAAGNVSAGTSASVAIGVPDTTPPTITSVLPLGGETGVYPGTSITVTFSEAVNPATVTSGNFVLRDASNTLVQAALVYNAASNRATLTPTAPLAGSTTYTAAVAGVADVAGNVLASNYNWSFTTGLAPGNGPGGPILVIASDSNPFTRYYAEILRTEGFNEFAVVDIASVTSTMLVSYDVAILGEMPLTTAQVTLLTTWVGNGGNLIAMRPDKKLAGLLGLTDQGGTLSNGYLQVDTATSPGAGIVGETIQFHGEADNYAVSEASVVATLYADASTPTSNPAVTLRGVGSNGGQAAAFSYDLARSVVYTRQGNPAWAGQERDGSAPIRSDDLFFGDKAEDPQPDWVDFNKIAVPQADEQQRLLANLVIAMNFDRKPLPRFWYFPRDFKAVVVMTGDDHDGGGTAGRFDSLINSSPSGCVADNWECARGTSYIYPTNPLTDAQAAAYNAAGFEIGLHLNTGCVDWTPAELESYFMDELGSWSMIYPSLASPVTNREHCIVWSDYVSMPMTEYAHGIRLDTTYYYWPAEWVNNRPGFFTGSGMPMRFATANGEFIDVYQAATQMTDESGQSYPFTVDSLLDKAVGVEGYYGVFTANAHTDSEVTNESTAIVNSALARGVPVISARQMLKWLGGRNASSFGSISWDGATLSFTVQAASGATGLRALVPTTSALGVAGITRDGSPVAYTMKTIKGAAYASFAVETGSYQVAYGSDQTPPTVTTVSPVNEAHSVSTGTSVSVTFSESMNSTTINTGTIELRNSSNTLVPAAITYNATTNTATLSPSSLLTNGTTYTATLKGGSQGVTDAAGNPLASDFIWSFTTTATTSHSIWDNSTVPSIITDWDPNAVELGVKFQSTVNGYITGIRFYKSPTNTGTHVGNLWTSSGTLLASVTFTNETASGWQQVEFPTPVAITANTTYVASYHTNVGYYSANGSYFSSSGFVNPPLIALGNSEGGGNGVYRYGASGFPDQTWNSSNYWVDVVFRQ